MPYNFGTHLPVKDDAEDESDPARLIDDSDSEDIDIASES